MLKSDERNPFPVSGYHGAALFCDRESESKLLVSNAANGVNTTLLSERRLGKTGLIFHVFAMMQRKKTTGIYVDIQATQSLRDFTNKLATSIFKVFPERNPIGKKFMLLLKSLRPVISFDALSGSPEVRFDFVQVQQYEQSISGLLQFLDGQDRKIVLAFDEFQQISSYPEKNVEALLRGMVQHLKHVNFIFSGSSQHLLAEMFGNTGRPFFSSTQSLYLGVIAKEKYKDFVHKKFLEHNRKISEEALEFIMDWTRLHTYYTQAMCNKLFASGIKKAGLAETWAIAGQILMEHEPVFFQYRNLLTRNQWALLKAIAMEDKVYKPGSTVFINQHGLGTPALVQRSLAALLEKEMIYRQQDEKGMYIRVYDCFLARWLQGQ